MVFVITIIAINTFETTGIVVVKGFVGAKGGIVIAKVCKGVAIQVAIEVFVIFLIRIARN